MTRFLLMLALALPVPAYAQSTLDCVRAIQALVPGTGVTIQGSDCTAAVLNNGQKIPDLTQIQAYLVQHPVPVPQTVSSVQAKVALLRAGLLASVQAWVDTQSAETQLVWNTTPGFNRNSGLIATGGVALGLTSAQLDQLFITAATINP